MLLHVGVVIIKAADFVLTVSFASEKCVLGSKFWTPAVQPLQQLHLLH
jgi:hypothetical protein